MSIQSWLRKRKASVFPEYLVRDYVQYHTWVRRTWRDLSLQRLRTSQSVVAYSSCCDDDDEGIRYGIRSPVFLRPATDTEVLAARKYKEKEGQHEIYLHYEGSPPRDQHALLFHFDFATKTWRTERYDDWLEIQTDAATIMREIARCQLAPLRDLPPVISALISDFLLDDVPDDVLPEEDDGSGTT